MTQEELIKKAVDWLYLNLDMPESEKIWWVNDFVDYMTIE